MKKVVKLFAIQNTDDFIERIEWFLVGVLGLLLMPEFMFVLERISPMPLLPITK